MYTKLNINNFQTKIRLIKQMLFIILKILYMIYNVNEHIDFYTQLQPQIVFNNLLLVHKKSLVEMAIFIEQQIL
jgi:hypothetical protein